MRVVVIMDPIETVVEATDTTFAIVAAAMERGHTVAHCRPADLSMVDDRISAHAHIMELDRGSLPPLRLRDPVDLDLCAVDAVLIRTDPPFDVGYLHVTLILEALRGRTLVVNDPRGLREANEKLYALRFPDLVPPTIITADGAQILRFATKHGAAVLKPIDGHAGHGIVRIDPFEDEVDEAISTATDSGNRPIVVQAFLAEVMAGDKRILLLDGEPLGAINRIPAEGDFRSNLAVGGRPEPASITSADQRIIAEIAPRLRADGLWFVGIDVIAGHLTEINVTSPTGLRQLHDFDGGHPEIRVIEWLESAQV